MKLQIYCIVSAKGVHSFYLTKEGRDYYLFSQDYRKGVQKYFGKSVSFTQAIDFSRAKRDQAVLRTMEKITMYSKFIEKNYGVIVRKNNQQRYVKKHNERIYA